MLLLVNAPTLYENQYLKKPQPLSFFEMKKKLLEGKTRFYPVEALGLLSIKAYCESEGIDTRYINGISANHHTLDETCAAIEALFLQNNFEPYLIGLTGASSVFHENLYIANRCKELWPKVKIILGSDFATLNYAKILDSYPIIDFICVGDGELLTASLVRAIQQNKNNYSDIAGLAWRDASNKIKYNVTKFIDINLLPIPARDDVSLILEQGYPATIYTTRGCPFKCSFCTTGQVSHLPGENSQTYRLRDMNIVLDEVEFLYKEYSIKNLMIVDDLFLSRSSLSKKRAYDFANGLIQRNIKINYMFDCRLDSIDLEMFKYLHLSGLRSIFVGIESGSKEQRAAYNKQLKEEQTPEFMLKKVAELGIDIIYGMITFHPNLTPTELLESIQLIDTLPSQRLNLLIHKLIPYPGTPIYNQYKKEGILNEEKWPVVTYNFKDKVIAEIYTQIENFFQQDKISYENIKEHIVKLLQYQSAA